MSRRSIVSGRLALFAVLAIASASCSSPLSASRFGQVVVDFSGVSRGPGLPSNIGSIDIAVTAADMAELRSTLTSPRLSATLEVPAGKDRLFSVLAKDSAGKVRYVGSSFRDIRGGEVVDLSVLMAKVFYITYDANAADATGSPPADEYYYKAGDTARAYENPNGLNRPGYRLLGWNTMPDGTGTTYVGDDTFSMPEGDLTLYAVWELSVTYTVTFFLYGGATSLTQSVPSNGLASAPSPEPTRPGYAFGGWFKDMAYAAPWTFGSDRVSADLTLYAKWTLETYSITYYLNGGLNDPGNPATYDVTSTPIALVAPTWGINSFLGWFSDAALTVPAPSITGGATGNAARYAKWNVPSFNVMFEKNLGSGVMPSQSIPNGTTVALSTNAYTRTGYAFMGWGTAPAGPVVYANGALFNMGAANVTLYAQWNANTYQVVFNPNGGIGSMPDQNIVFDAMLPLTPNTFTRTGYTFEGWGTAPAGPVVFADTQSFMMNVPGQILYAQWTANSYMVTFDSQGGSGAVPSMINVTYDAPYGALATTSQVGYTFAGWWTGIGGTGVEITSGTIASITGPQMLYAFFTGPFSGGSGTAPDPYLVSSVAQLKDMNGFRTSFFKLTANLDLSGESNWLPIGDSTTPFSGGFDGDVFVLGNLTINAMGNQDRGLFGYTNGAVIKNVSLTNINFIATGNNAGGLIGTAAGATQVLNCSVAGSLAAYQSAGGLIGNAEAGNSLTVTDSWANVNIDSGSYGALGGLIGYTAAGGTGSVTGSFALGTITESSSFNVDHVGGLIGYNGGLAVIDCYARGNVTGTNNVGGLIGNNSSNVTRAYSVGAVTATTNPGGLIGWNSAGTITASRYDENTSGQLDTGKGEPLITAAMQTESTFTAMSWDFVTTWEIITVSYPTFR